MLIAAAVQFQPRFARCAAEVSDNFRRCLPLIEKASKFGPQLMVFPELCMTGYSFRNGQEASLVAERWDGPTFREMRSVAADLECYVAWGYVESGETGALHNAATVVAPTGEVVCRYRKVNLFSADFLWATPGDTPPQVVRTEFGTLSVVVCRDIRARIPHNIPRIASSSTPFFPHEKPDVVAACTNWGRGGFPSTTWMDFAANNNCSLVVSNRYGVEENEGFVSDFGMGGSAIIEPNWRVHTDGLEFSKDCVVVAAVDPRQPGAI